MELTYRGDAYEIPTSSQLASFDIISAENGFSSIHPTQEKLPTIEEYAKSHTPQSIFPSISQLREVFEFIELNYHRSIKLKEVAHAVGYSSSYLTDLVRRLTGKTVNNWIIERRITEANTLLLETDKSVDQIAIEVGYQNINHFYRQFRNYHQTTPKIWRDKQRSHPLPE